MTITIGADPELFVMKDGQFVSAHGLVQGSKYDPTPVEKGAVQVDGMALEFNIDPAEDHETFYHNINVVLAELRNMVPRDFDFAITSQAEFPDGYIEQQPAEARALGCDPDYNAWTGMLNVPPDPNTNMRTAAGHVHIGWTQDQDVNDPAHFNGCCTLVKELDATLGIWSVLNDREGAARRAMYGQAGAFRPKPYGVEYRVLSNFWLKSREFSDNVYLMCYGAVRRLQRGTPLIHQQMLEQGYDIQAVINNNDATLARYGWEEFSI